MIAVLFFVVGIVVLLHHCWVHYHEAEPSNARKESCCLVCYFQPKDISHYESWSLIVLTGAFWVGLSSTSGAHSEYLSVFAVLMGVMGFIFLMLGAFRFEGGSEGGLKLQNIRNHETWIVLCFVNAFVLVSIS